MENSNERHEVIKGLTETHSKISRYLEYLKNAGTGRKVQIQHEKEKLASIQRAINYIKENRNDR